MALFAGCVASCKPTYEEQVESLAGQVKKVPIGTSGDQWLVKNNFFGQDERLALIFGYMDDQSFCLEVAQLYMQKYPADRYKCRPAN